MSRLALVALVLVTAACGQESTPIEEQAVDASIVTPEPVPSVADWALSLLEETNNIMEECIMPAQGLYPKSKTCDMPPSECKEDDR